MPQLIGLLVLGAAGWLAYRWLRKEMTRVQADLDEAEEALNKREARQVTRLERDPETGVYRPRDE